MPPADAKGTHIGLVCGANYRSFYTHHIKCIKPLSHLVVREVVKVVRKHVNTEVKKGTFKKKNFKSN
jgi:hypothetical protein